MPSFSPTLEQAIHAALALANSHRHELATLEHLLFALTDEPDAARVLRACAVDLGELRRSLEDFIRYKEEIIASGRYGLVDDFDVPVGLYLQPAPARDILARMLRNLKEVHRSHQDWPRQIAVLDRLLILLPEAWTEYRDRGLAWAEMGDARLAVADLEIYVEHTEDMLEREAVSDRLAELRRALS